MASGTALASWAWCRARSPSLQAPYEAFVASRLPGGLLVACHDDEGSLGLARRDAAAGRRVLTYGFDPDADVALSDAVDAVRRARLQRDGDDRRPRRVPRSLRVAMPGRHNLQNAAAAYAAAVLGLGADPEAVLRGLSDFTGARRRFEVIGTANGCDGGRRLRAQRRQGDRAGPHRRRPGRRRPSARRLPTAPVLADPRLRRRLRCRTGRRRRRRPAAHLRR